MMICNADRVRGWLDEHEETSMLADGFDDAVIGLTRDLKTGKYRVVYDVKRCLHILINDHGMDEDEAIEHLEVNVVGAYVGDMTPVWMFLPAVDEDDD